MPYESASNLKEMSLLYWAEHSVECAVPACYQSCDLYQPRSDERFRRFAFGAYKNRNLTSLRGYGVEVSLRTKYKFRTEQKGRFKILWNRGLSNDK